MTEEDFASENNPVGYGTLSSSAIHSALYVNMAETGNIYLTYVKDNPSPLTNLLADSPGTSVYEFIKLSLFLHYKFVSWNSYPHKCDRTCLSKCSKEINLPLKN